MQREAAELTLFHYLDHTVDKLYYELNCPTNLHNSTGVVRVAW